MPSKLRFALRPGWIVLHLITIAAMVTMVKLGWWQMTVSERRGFSILNFGYALQWWAFSIFTAFMWVRLMRDQVHRLEHPEGSQDAESAPAEKPAVPYRRYEMPQSSSASDSSDPVVAAYNEYLAQLSRKTAEGPDAERTTS